MKSAIKEFENKGFTLIYKNKTHYVLRKESTSIHLDMPRNNTKTLFTRMNTNGVDISNKNYQNMTLHIYSNEIELAFYDSKDYKKAIEYFFKVINIIKTENKENIIKLLEVS